MRNSLIEQRGPIKLARILVSACFRSQTANDEILEFYYDSRQWFRRVPIGTRKQPENIKIRRLGWKSWAEIAAVSP